MNDEALSETLGLIYEAAVAPDRWPELPHRLARGFDCHFCGMNISGANRDEFRAIAVGVDRAEHQAYLRRFNRTNPVTLRLPPDVAGELIEVGSVITRAEFEQLEMYQAFFQPNDMGHTARMTIWRGPAGTQSITVSRSWQSSLNLYGI